jgi:branched-chain amino acid aminotransferase
MVNLEWEKLPFGYQKTNYNVRCYFRNGAWGELEVSSSESINIHMAATCLHYGQEAFEGLKAYRGKDGKIRLFRWIENARRMQSSARGIMMAEVPEEIFYQSIKKVVELNQEFVPPFGTGASLYLRPLLIGTGAQVGVKPASEYLFVVFASPVGPYFKEGFKPVNMMICRSHDRAAPLGTGHIKVGGNYAASLVSLKKGQDRGFSSVIYLDAKQKEYIDECGPANFFAIKNNTYITPESTSILPSITNKSLLQVAIDLGLKAERRPIHISELPTFEEIGACGTAAVISPIGKIVDEVTEEVIVYSKDGQPGPISKKIYEKLLAIQTGEEPDKHGWVEVLNF